MNFGLPIVISSRPEFAGCSIELTDAAKASPRQPAVVLNQSVQCIVFCGIDPDIALLTWSMRVLDSNWRWNVWFSESLMSS